MIQATQYSQIIKQIQLYIKQSSHQYQIQSFQIEYSNNQKETQQKQKHFIIQLYQLVQQKDQTIKNLSSQITKYKCQAINQSKLIANLQDKLNKLQPNANNTTSNFMMPSQFKDAFQDFMNSHLTLALDPFIQLQTSKMPVIFAKTVQTIFNSYYQYVKNQIKDKIDKITSILNLKETQKQFEQQILNNLLRIFQDNWKQLVPYQKLKPQIINIKKKYTIKANEMYQSQQYDQMSQLLHKLCVYMILQQKKWKFIWSSQQKSCILFNKKDYICLDGFVKQQSKAFVILQGLIRQQHRHASIKSYVLPYNCQQQQEQSQQQKESQIIHNSMYFQSQIKQNKGQKQQNKSFMNFQNVQVVQQKQNSLTSSIQKDKNFEKKEMLQLHDKYQGKIVKANLGQKQKKENQQNLTLHKLLMQRNRKQIQKRTYKFKEDLKLNNWISQKKKDVTSVSSNITNQKNCQKNQEDRQNIFQHGRSKSKSKEKNLVRGISKRKKGFSEINLKNPIQKGLYSRQQNYTSETSLANQIQCNLNSQNVSPNMLLNSKGKTKNVRKFNKSIDKEKNKQKTHIQSSPRITRIDSKQLKHIKHDTSNKQFKDYQDNIISKAQKKKKDDKILQRKKSLKEVTEIQSNKCQYVNDYQKQMANLKKLRSQLANNHLNNGKNHLNINSNKAYILLNKPEQNAFQEPYTFNRVNSNNYSNGFFKQLSGKQNQQQFKMNRNSKKSSVGKIVTQNPNQKYQDIIRSKIMDHQIPKSSTDRQQNRPLKSTKLRQKYLG